MEDYLKYTTKEMAELLDPKFRYRLFQGLWITMAEIQKELGFPGITQEIITEMRRVPSPTDEDLKKAKEAEAITKHEVMAQMQVFKEHLSPEAGKFVHLACTSCYVQDNSDMLIYIAALNKIKNKMVFLIKLLDKLAMQEKDTVCLGLTHNQPAQFVTVGKRFQLFNQDIYLNLRRLERLMKKDLYLLGAKGATGTQDSYLKLFDKEKVEEIDRKFLKNLIRQGVGLDHKVIPLSGQTYPRIMDNFILDTLGEIASSLHRIAENIRLWQGQQEVYEPFETEQVGSSAMPYKQNPMRCERICSLARVVMANKMVENNAYQWYERTLDDSANRRLKMKESILLTDYIVTLMCNVIDGIKIVKPSIAKHVKKHMNYVVTENIMIRMCASGSDRNEVHEKIRKITLKIGENELNGISSDIVQIVKSDDYFKPIHGEIDGMMDPALYTGMCAEQVESFHQYEVDGYLDVPCAPFSIEFNY